MAGKQARRPPPPAVSELYVFRSLAEKEWWRSLMALRRSLDGRRERERGTRSAAGVAGRYADLVAALIRERHASLEAALAAGLLEGEAVLAREEGELPDGLRQAALLDIELLQELLEEEWQDRAEESCGKELPPLRLLSDGAAREPFSGGEMESFVARLKHEEPEDLLVTLQKHYLAAGTGVVASYLAFRWQSHELRGIARPSRDRLEDLVGLDSQLERLTTNVERFLASRPALHTLLYGPRGSGKSTAVRGLLSRYSERGLRLVEVAPESLGYLPELSEQLRPAPYRFLVYVDDLSFESGDAGYAPLKTLLEGSVGERPPNVLLIATSNRRHLVREGFSDRPNPESDDVHGWDTTNERLALADRFGLTITFPGADQRKYLAMVHEMARIKGIEPKGSEFDEAAIRFADWGNGYSGRTARQFVDTLD